MPRLPRQSQACVSVLMPCRNAGPFLEKAIASVIQQSQCLELLIADGGSTDGSLDILEKAARDDQRIKIVSRKDNGPADALNKCLRKAKGTFIGWLNADDIYTTGSLARAVNALEQHPQWIMTIGEGEEFNESSGYTKRYPTIPPSRGLNSLLSHCCICQPTVVFKRAMPILIGELDNKWKTTFDFEYWLRAYSSFPNRIGYVPHVQAKTRLHEATITNQQRQLVALEASALLSKYFKSSGMRRLYNYAIELKEGTATLPYNTTFKSHLNETLEIAQEWLKPEEIIQFKQDWELEKEDSQNLLKRQRLDTTTSSSTLGEQFLYILHPNLDPTRSRSPSETKQITTETIKILRKKYTLLATDDDKAIMKLSQSTKTFEDRKFGVNLIGHAFETFGIGEDIRMAAQALKAAGVPCCVINHPANNGSKCTDRTLDSLLCKDPNNAPYAFNLICMTAPIQGRWLLENGLNSLFGRYTIGAWPWETSEIPKSWLPLLNVADELWPSSSFTAASFQEPAKEKKITIKTMPMSAQIESPKDYCTSKQRAINREIFKLPQEKILFCYSFDFNSTAIRKNPMGALNAFQNAFPLPYLPACYDKKNNTHEFSSQVGLVIKTFKPNPNNPDWHWLKCRVQEDPRIVLIADSFDREKLLALFGCCDVFLSLHRSEGFGRGMAEALQLGLDIIASNYGGNTDFCKGPLAHLVPCKEVPIPKGSYPYADGHSWGEPDIDYAAQLMRSITKKRLEAKISNHIRKIDEIDCLSSADSYRRYFSHASTGSRYKDRLMKLWSNRIEISKQIDHKFRNQPFL
ncbi:glycosyltransferase [bacterium]|nr:glycosyltransferase [bacterium]